MLWCYHGIKHIKVIIKRICTERLQWDHDHHQLFNVSNPIKRLEFQSLSDISREFSPPRQSPHTVRYWFTITIKIITITIDHYHHHQDDHYHPPGSPWTQCSSWYSSSSDRTVGLRWNITYNIIVTIIFHETLWKHQTLPNNLVVTKVEGVLARVAECPKVPAQ